MAEGSPPAKTRGRLLRGEGPPAGVPKWVKAQDGDGGGRGKTGHTRGGTARPPPPPDRASHTPWGSHPTGTEGRTPTNGLPTGPCQEDHSRMHSNRKKQKRVTRASSGHVHGHWRSRFSKSAFSGSLDRLPPPGVGGGTGFTIPSGGGRADGQVVKLQVRILTHDSSLNYVNIIHTIF